MPSIVEGKMKTVYGKLTHFIGRLTRKYYFEDFVRVYPDGLAFDEFGRKREFSELERRCFLNHQKVYKFASQFVAGKVVCDVGCGSGYGCKVLKESGAVKVCGSDISKSAISYARREFGKCAEYGIQTCTDLKLYADDSFDVTVCSEVIEHVKEYSMEDSALAEIRRVTRRDGIIVLGTPNTEMCGDHGFSFPELLSLIGRHFQSFVIFENALINHGFVPDSVRAWNERQASGKTGVIVSERISFSETVLPLEVKECDVLLKKGLPAGVYRLKNIDIDTRLLHNTHSFLAVIVNDHK